MEGKIPKLENTEEWTDEHLIARRLLVDLNTEDMSTDQKLDLFKSLIENEPEDILGEEQDNLTKFLLSQDYDKVKLLKILENEIGKEERGQYETLKNTYLQAYDEVIDSEIGIKFKEATEDTAEKIADIWLEQHLVFSEEENRIKLESISEKSVPPEGRSLFDKVFVHQTDFLLAVGKRLENMLPGSIKHPEFFWVIFRIQKDKGIKFNEEFWNKVKDIVIKKIN